MGKLLKCRNTNITMDFIIKTDYTALKAFLQSTHNDSTISHSKSHTAMKSTAVWLKYTFQIKFKSRGDSTEISSKNIKCTPKNYFVYVTRRLFNELPFT